MITKTQKFMQGHWGKFLLFSMAFAILYTGYGCTSYQQVSMAKNDFMVNPQIQASIADYNIYLHDGATTYRMQEPQIVDGRHIGGVLSATTYEDAKTDWKRAERKEWWKNHKYDIHIYTHENFNSTASLTGTPSVPQDRVVVSDAMIKEIKVMSIDKKGEASDAVVVVVVLAGVALIVLLVLLIMEEGNGGGGGGSDSGSGSDSGESSD